MNLLCRILLSLLLVTALPAAASETHPGGNTGALQYNNATYFGGNNAITSDGVNLIFDMGIAPVIKDSNSVISIQPTIRRLTNSGGADSVNYDIGYLYDSNGTDISIDWGARDLYGIGGTSSGVYAIDYSGSLNSAFNLSFDTTDVYTNATSIITPKSDSGKPLVLQGFSITQSAPYLTLSGVSSTAANRALVDINAAFATSTDASYKGRGFLRAWDFNGVAREAFRWESSGTVAQIGFFGTTSVAQQTGNTATALSNYGLVTSATWPTTSLTGTLAAGQFPALTGDVTTSAGSLATTIANNAVTNAKFRAGIARSVVGVTGNASANVADIQGTASQVLVVNSAGTSLAFGQVDLSSQNAVVNLLGPAFGGLGIVGPTRAAGVTNITNSPAAITGLTANLVGNAGYVGQLVVFANNSTAAEGLQFDFGGGSASLIGGGYIEYGFSGTPIGTTLGTTTSIALTVPITATTATSTDDVYIIPFTVMVKSNGTLIPRFAEVSTHITGTATITRAYMFITQTNN